MINKLRFNRLGKHTALSMGMLIGCTIFALAMFEDFIHSSRNDYPYFWYESALFSLFWLCFIPVLYGLNRLKASIQHLKTPFLLALLPMAILIHAAVAATVVSGLSSLVKQQGYSFTKVFSYALANHLLPMVLVYVLAVLFLRRKATKTTNKNTEFNQVPCLTIRQGATRQQVPFQDISHICSETPYLAIYTKQSRYLYTSSIKAIIELLDERFIRVHRAHIVNIERVESVRSRLNGDYDLVLMCGTEVRLSRHYAKRFKSRYFNSSS